MSDDPLSLLEQYDFDLPKEQIAQWPAREREDARLLCVDRARGALAHSTMRDFAARLTPKDLLVVNATQVVPARLRGAKQSGGRAEALLLGRVAGEPAQWRALVSCRGRVRPGLRFCFADALDAVVEAVEPDGVVRLSFPTLPAAETSPYRYGDTPLPPYIRDGVAEAADRERYQTLFARVPGSVAARAAGLHFGPALLDALQTRGIARAEVVLEVGVGTFRPLRAAQLETGALHAEAFTLPAATAKAITATRARGGRVVAVGTTTVRVLETCAREDGQVNAGSGETTLFLRPGARFRVVDALLTNFHLPRSSLLLLVAAFAGRELTLRAYREAVATGYRFYSYGDAMWLA